MSGLSEMTAPNVVREAITAGGGRDGGAFLAQRLRNFFNL